ncbi:phage portal protein [Eremococcus coleocola]|uniref:phage portal protein n=1 Tax=Eremococcus coleocola TaxID=88132 RepID=UPI00040C7753|nr:phage portal protein [Eremococcus coleocola]
MLEKLFYKDVQATAELHDKWGTLFDIYVDRDKLNSAHAAPSNALLFDTVYACINVLSDDIAKLPFKTYKRDPKTGSIKPITDSDIYNILRVAPNRYMTPYTFLKLLVTDVCTWGNFYALIEFNNKGNVKELKPLVASITRPVIDVDTGNLYYQTTVDGDSQLYYSSEIIHIKGMTTDGIIGMSPIDAVRLQLESNDIANKYNYNMIRNGGLPQGILTAQGMLDTKAKQKVREAWEQINNNQSIAVVDQGLEYKQIGISQSDMQWLSSQKYNSQRIASIFKVPLHKINDLDKATYTNIEHQSLDYVKNTLQPWVVQIEQEFMNKLFTDDEVKQGYYVKFNMDSELRGDSKSRAEVNQINFANGFNTINEIRAKNEDSPYDKDYGNEPFISLNYAPAKNIDLFHTNNFGVALQGGDKSNEREPNDNQQGKQDEEQQESELDRH